MRFTSKHVVWDISLKKLELYDEVITIVVSF